MTTTKTTADGLDHQTKTVPIVDRSILMHVTLRLAKSFFFLASCHAARRRAVSTPGPGSGSGTMGCRTPIRRLLGRVEPEKP